MRLLHTDGMLALFVGSREDVTAHRNGLHRQGISSVICLEEYAHLSHLELQNVAVMHLPVDPQGTNFLPVMRYIHAILARLRNFATKPIHILVQCELGNVFAPAVVAGHLMLARRCTFAELCAASAEDAMAHESIPVFLTRQLLQLKSRAQ